MTTTATTPEQMRIQSLAAEYRARGYEVVVEPAADALPDFLLNRHVDLIARRGSEQLVVEVKSRGNLTTEKGVRELARLVRSHPDWSFELVVVGDSENPPFAGANSLQRNEILKMADDAEMICDTGSTEAALLLAWAGAEAALRLAIQQEGIALTDVNPAFILKKAVTEGLIARSDYELAARAMKYRNAVAHGYEAPEFDRSLVQDLTRLTRDLVAKDGAPQAAQAV